MTIFDDMARRTWDFGNWSLAMGIGTPNGPNDPFYGHLRVEGVIQLLEMVIIHKKVWHPWT